MNTYNVQSQVRSVPGEELTLFQTGKPEQFNKFQQKFRITPSKK